MKTFFLVLTIGFILMSVIAVINEAGIFQSQDDPVYKQMRINKEFNQLVPRAQPLIENGIRTIADKHHLQFLLYGRVGTSKNCSTTVSFALYARQPLSLDEAKILAHTISQEFFDFLEKSPELHQILASQSSQVMDLIHNTFGAKNSSFRISFWDEHDNRQRTPNIAEIRLDDGVLRFFATKSSDTNEIELVYEEPYIPNNQISVREPK